MGDPTDAADRSRHEYRPWPVEEGSYVGRHWHGELSLPISFWVNSVVLNIIFGLIVYFVVYAVARGGNVGWTIAILCVVISFSVVLSVWQLVGIWRSADNHKHYTGRKGWATAAQVLVVLGWLGLARNIYEALATIGELSSR